MQNGIDLYALDIGGASFVKACGGSTHPDGESCVTLARIGDDAWALGDSKRPDAQPLRFTAKELGAVGIDPARFGLSA
ncbi:DUF397 domain-containing protein [Streptomyces sp. NPDC046985]|uniref:DUF397 domain-containing protein n=1 Tax=Streptomyces sp. NPDC046985 TaxID=3155377 RepID=UPI0033EBCB56